MKTLKLLEDLKRKTVFGVSDIERITLSDRSYAIQILERLVKKNLIKRIRRNAYTVKDNIFLIASNIVYPSYISFWSASYFLGYTEQIVNIVQVACTRKTDTIKFEKYKITFVPMKHFFGYRKIRTDEGELFVAEDEKLLIDAFLRPDMCGNFNEIEKMFSNTKISEEKITDYLKRTKNLSVIKKVGFLLQKTREIDISEHFAMDRNYAILNPFSEKWSKTDSKWRIKY